jgi:hypothetical protein
MKFIDEEKDKQKLAEIGIKVEKIKQLQKEVLEFFVDNGEPVYDGTEDIISILNLYEKGENLDYIGELVFQSDAEPVIKMLNIFGIKMIY